jgi:putative hemolysin
MPSATIKPRNPLGIRAGLRFSAGSVAGTIALGVSVLWGTPLPASAGTESLPVAQPVPGTEFLTGVSCTSVTFCVAIGNNPEEPFVVPITDGVAGAPEGIPGYGQPGTPTDMDLNGVTCTSKVSCIAVGTGEIPDPPSRMMGVGVIVSITSGVPGSVQQVSGVGQIGVPDSIIFYGVSCWSATSCVAVGSDTYLDGVAVPITDGVAGTELPVQAYQLNSVFCRTSGGCLALGSGPVSGSVVVPLKNGALGNGGGTVKDSSGLNSVACRVSSACLAVGGGSLVAPMTRKHPGRAKPVSGASALNGVACNGTTYCLAVGSNASNEGAMVRITSEAPGIVQTVPGTSGLDSIACPDPDSCVAVGQNASGEGVIDTLPLSPGG